MTEHDDSKADPDPLSSVADAMEEAAAGMRDDADPGAPDEQAAEALGDAAKALYTTCYYLSFGVVFASVYVARMIPSDNTMVRGFRDGARSACDSVLQRERARAEAAAEWESVMGDEDDPDDEGPDGEPATETT